MYGKYEKRRSLYFKKIFMECLPSGRADVMLTFRKGHSDGRADGMLTLRKGQSDGRA
jgi:hypothetical protein